MKHGGYTYIMTNKDNTVLYTGVTSNLVKRYKEHLEKVHPKSFTARYNINKLVYFKGFHRIEEAINEEKKIKGGSRKKKETFINEINNNWNNLFEELIKN